MAKITVRGMDELNAKLEQIGGDMKPTLKKAMEKSVLYVQGTIPPYPPPPPASRYRRRVSGGIGGSFTTEVRELGGTEIVGVIGSNIEYAPWVISETVAHGAGPQASFHRGRWYTLQNVVRKAFPAVVKIHEDFIRKLLR